MKRQGVENLRLNTPNAIEDVWFSDETGKAYLSRCANSSVYPANTLYLTDRIKCNDKHEADKNWFERWFSD